LPSGVTKPSKHNFIETPIEKEDMSTCDTYNGKSSHGLEVLEFAPSHKSRMVHSLKFKVDLSHLRNHTITHIHLQIMGSHPSKEYAAMYSNYKHAKDSFAQSPLQVSLFKHEANISCGPLTAPRVDKKIEWHDEFEVGEVWVSPNLIGLFPKSKITSDLMEFVIGIEGGEELSPLSNFFGLQRGKRGFYGHHESKLKSCVSPTLTLSTIRH
jgi:hypothetical protein